MLDQMVKEDRQLIQFSTVPEIVKLKREQVPAQSLKLYVHSYATSRTYVIQII